MIKSHPGGTGFEGMKVSWRAAEVWHCESHGRPLVKVQLSCNWWPRTEGVMQRSWGLAPWREPMRGYCWSQVTVEDSSILEMLVPRTAAAVEYTQLELRRHGVCYKGQGWRNDPSPWRSPEDCELDPGHWMVGDWFLLLIVSVPWYFSLLKEENILVEPTVKRLLIVKKDFGF